jgi:hypothetical protein
LASTAGRFAAGFAFCLRAMVPRVLGRQRVSRAGLFGRAVGVFKSASARTFV